MKDFNLMFHEACFRGSGFVGGKRRIYMFYTQKHPSRDEFAKFLSKEYGIGGTASLGNWVDYNGKGIRVRYYDHDSKKFLYDERFTWKQAADEIKKMIDSRTYMGVRDYADQDSWYALRKAVYAYIA